VILPAGDGDITADRAVFTCAITADNTLSCWGRNDQGQLGTGDKEQRPLPTKVSGLEANISKAASGAGHSCAQTTDGKLLCWGRNDAGQLGTGDLGAHLAPVPIALPISIERLTAGGTSTCVRGTDATLYCFGANEHGQLGLGSTTQTPKPTAVTPLAGKIVRVSSGAGHTCAFTTDGSLYCWGDNRDGQLGTGDTTPKSAPVKIDAQGAVTDVFAGGAHTCAVKVDGSVWCWGNNQYGQLGVEVGPVANAPVQVIAPCQ